MALSSGPAPVLIGDSSLHSWRVIGSGRFGKIYKARHYQWGCDVAVKLLDDVWSSSSLLHEVNLMRQVSSPYIVHVHGVFQGRLPSSGASSQLGLVMEFTERGSLASLQDSLCGPPPWPLAFRLAHQVALGINYLHSLSPPLLHMHLKPNNVLLDDSLNAKLTDFGLGRYYCSLTLQSKKGREINIGTIRYMPPEEACEISYSPTCTSDIYSYGILLWSIVTGQQPYSHLNCFQVLWHVADGKRPSLAEINQDQAAGLRNLVELMERCWGAVPTERPSSLVCTAVTEELFNIHKHAINIAVHQVLAELDQTEGEQRITEGLINVHVTQPLVMNQWRIVLMGKTGAGKSSVGNTIFGGETVFQICDSPISGTSQCQAEKRSVEGRSVTLIDTPGFFDTAKSEEKLRPEIVRCITECAPGPHVFLIVLKVENYTDQEVEVIKKMCDSFSEEAFRYAAVLFTHGNDLPEGETIQLYVRKSEGLSELVEKCGGRCHVIDNKHWNNNQQENYRSNQFQVAELLRTIDEIVEENNGGCYSNKILQEVEREIQQEAERIRQSSGNISEEEARERAKTKVVNWFLIKFAGFATGALLETFFGVAVIVVHKGFQKVMEQYREAEEQFREAKEWYRYENVWYREVKERYREVEERFREVNVWYRETKERFREAKERFREAKEQSREAKEQSREVGERAREVEEWYREVEEQYREAKEQSREVGERAREVEEWYREVEERYREAKEWFREAEEKQKSIQLLLTAAQSKRKLKESSDSTEDGDTRIQKGKDTDMLPRSSSHQEAPDNPLLLEKWSSRSCTSCGGVMDSSDWTEVEPEVTRVKGVPTYSLQSRAGHFECRVSGLRWVCQENVRIKYQFASWEEHMERLKGLQYTPGGSLLDITVIGKLDEVHLPHWICLDHNLTISDKFAVLHIDTDGDVVEQVSEVTPFHVKICQPTFSLWGVIWTALFPVKVHCNVLIYKVNKATSNASLTLHVYLIPDDHTKLQAVQNQEKSYRSKIIPKPYPEDALQMKGRFILTTEMPDTTIGPKELQLTCERNTPNYYEVYIEKANTKFTLTLESAHCMDLYRHVIWTCTIREDEYQSAKKDQRPGQHFVDRHRTALIERVTNPAPILDRLKDRRFISEESYDTVRTERTTQNQMRTIFRLLKSPGATGKDYLYEILKEQYEELISELEDLD